MASRAGRADASGGKSRPTSSDVAAAAGVSRSAVSFAFNQPERISAATRQRILDAAGRLGYTPNTLARMLKAGQTQSLGVLLPQNLAKVMENPYYAQFLTGVGQICDQEGFTLLLTPPLRDSMLKAIPYAAVDGFIVCGLEHDRGEVAELERRGVPFVLVDSSRYDNVPSVDVDDERAGGVRHGMTFPTSVLGDLGEGIIQSPQEYSAGGDRLRRLRRNLLYGDRLYHGVRHGKRYRDAGLELGAVRRCSHQDGFGLGLEHRVLRGLDQRLRLRVSQHQCRLAFALLHGQVPVPASVHGTRA